MDEYPQYDFYNSREECDGKGEGRGSKEGGYGREGEDKEKMGKQAGQEERNHSRNEKRRRPEKEMTISQRKREGKNKSSLLDVGPPPTGRKPLVDLSTICMLSGVNLH